MKLSVPSLLLCATVVAPLSAQSLEEGYQSTFRAMPDYAGGMTYLDDGSLAYFDTFGGTDLLLEQDGQVTTLLQLASPSFVSFIVQVRPDALLFGESSGGQVWLVPLDTSVAPTLLATVVFNYSAVAWDADTALISAKVGGFSTPNNDILALDLNTGGTDTIALIPGSSGPIAVDDSGDLYYATASATFPQPPGYADVLRFDRAEVDAAFGPTNLADTDADIVWSGLDAAGTITFDSDGDLFALDWANNQVVEISDPEGPWTRMSILADYSNASVFLNGLQFVKSPIGSDDWRFEPFQPLLAGALVFGETNFGALSSLRFATPKRPVSVATPSVTPAAAPFAIHTFGAPANAIGIMRWGDPQNMTTEFPLAVGALEQPIPWGLLAPVAGLPISFDATGTSTLELTNPGFGFMLDVAVQVVFVNPASTVVGSAETIVFSLL